MVPITTRPAAQPMDNAAPADDQSPQAGPDDSPALSNPDAADASLRLKPSALSSIKARQLVESWQDLTMNFAVLMGGFKADPAWLDKLERISEKVRALLAQDADAALYMMLQTANSEFTHYSAHHSMHCAVVAHLCSEWFDWPEHERRALFQAALSMNVAMLSLQDSMVRQSSRVSPEQRRQIDEHARQGSELLASAGVSDGLWLETVLRHHKPFTEAEKKKRTPHDDGHGGSGKAGHDGTGEGGPHRTPAQRLAELLHRIDVFTAKLSRRQSRSAASATVAARDACLGDSGHPDEIGATILRVLGLYPPGSYVCLANGELAVVTRRGAKAHTPVVASLKLVDGSLIGKPVRRDTALPAFAVRRAAVASEFRLVLNHERLLSI